MASAPPLSANGNAWILPSDVASGVMGALFKFALPSTPGSYRMVVGYSLVNSIVARMVPGWTGSFTQLGASQKSAIVLAILGAVEGYVQHKDPVTGAVSYVSIDLLGQELISLLSMKDSFSA